jgi:heterodisulfide reductase subunit C
MLNKPDPLIAELIKYIDKIYSTDDITKEQKAKAIYAWIEQKVHNELVREYNRNWQCSICGAEKPSK